MTLLPNSKADQWLRLYKTWRAKVACVVGVILLIVVIDKLDFVARWLDHLEPYKNNIERVLYAFLFLLAASTIAKKFKGCAVFKNIKGLKANIAGVFGFEFEFAKENADSDQCEDARQKSDNAVEKSSLNNRPVFYVDVVTRKIISILSTELQLTFAPNAILRRGGCRYRPDGFAVKNGRAYIVEVKAVDRPYLIDRAIAQLKTFANIEQDRKISHVTVIFCVISNRPIESFSNMIKRFDFGPETEFILRVFSPAMLESKKFESS